MATTDACGPPWSSVTLAPPPPVRTRRGRYDSSPNEDGGLWFPSISQVTSACPVSAGWAAVSLSPAVFSLFFAPLCPCLLSPSGCLSASASGLLHPGPTLRPPLHSSSTRRDRTSCPRERAFPGLRVTRRGSDSGGHPCRLPMPQPCPQLGLAATRPLARAPSPRIGTRAEPAHAPAASPRGVSAHARSPLPQRPAGAAGGQPAARLGGGGAACARAQKGRRSVAQLAEEKAARRGAGRWVVGQRDGRR